MRLNCLYFFIKKNECMFIFNKNIMVLNITAYNVSACYEIVIDLIKKYFNIGLDDEFSIINLLFKNRKIKRNASKFAISKALIECKSTFGIIIRHETQYGIETFAIKNNENYVFLNNYSKEYKFMTTIFKNSEDQSCKNKVELLYYMNILSRLNHIMYQKKYRINRIIIDSPIIEFNLIHI